MKGNISGFGPEYMQHFNIFRYRSPICAVFPRTGPQSTGPIPCSKGSVKENFVILHFTIALTRFQYFDVSGNYKHISFFLGKHFFIIGLGLVFCSGPSPGEYGTYSELQLYYDSHIVTQLQNIKTLMIQITNTESHALPG